MTASEQARLPASAASAGLRERVAALASRMNELYAAGNPPISGTLAAFARELRGVLDDAWTETWGDRNALAEWIRSDENLVLAEHGLEQSVPTLDDVLFHLERSLSYLTAYTNRLVEQTRAIDRSRNSAEFMSG